MNLRERVRRSDWWAGLATGVASSTFSTGFVQLGARQLGRDPAVDWMQVGAVPLRSRAVHRHPTVGSQAAGIASHQFADIMWATIFGGAILARVPERHRKKVIAAGALPWAAASAGAEFFVFLPWVQPLLRMQVPYWTAFGVHAASSSAYPLFSAFRHGDRRSARRTAGWMAGCLVGLGVLAWLDRRRQTPRWPQAEDRQQADVEFLHRMSGHHETGLRLASLAADHADHPNLRTLGRLMVAQHGAELDLMATWHESWSGEPVPELSDEDRREMEGMPDETELVELAGRRGVAFDECFLELMVPHHRAAIHMSEEAMERSRDPRVIALAAGIAHTQRGQIDAMETRSLGV